MTTWPAVLGPLTRREQLPEADIRWAMTEIMSGAATPAQVSAFVVSLRMRGETAADIAALVDVMLDFAVRIDADGPALDTCGTGGDGAHTVNISTMAAILLASHGVRVVKHGNRAASSKCGSADVLEALGVRIDLTPEQTQSVFDAEPTSITVTSWGIRRSSTAELRMCRSQSRSTSRGPMSPRSSPAVARRAS